ncbi:PKD domain-containing protein [Salinisphaera sp. T31B1]
MLLLSLCLSACGGGGGGGSDDDRNDGGGDPDPGVPSATLNADAGNDRDVVTGSSVTLDGSNTRVAEGVTIEFAWRLTSKPSNSQAQLDEANTATPRFSADADGRYVAELVVTDGDGNRSTDRVVITATSANTRPLARAGADQSVKTGVTVTLDGRNSNDADGDTLTYRWTFVSRAAGSNARLNNAATATPSFVADESGEYVLSLVVSDGRLTSLADRVTITAARANSAPMAVAGDDQSVAVNDQVQLDGSASSDADGDRLSYAWRIVSRPQGSSASLASPNSVRPSLTTDTVGDYVLELRVSDGQASATDRVTVSAGPVLVFSVDAGDPTDGSPDYEVVEPNIFASQLTVQNIPAGSNELESLRAGRFRLTAIGQDFTVVDLTSTIVRASNTTASPQLSFNGLAQGDTIAAGDSLDFATMAENIPVPGEYRFDFGFKIRETGETFSLRFRVDLTDID